MPFASRGDQSSYGTLHEAIQCLCCWLLRPMTLPCNRRSGTLEQWLQHSEVQHMLFLHQTLPCRQPSWLCLMVISPIAHPGSPRALKATLSWLFTRALLCACWYSCKATSVFTPHQYFVFCYVRSVLATRRGTVAPSNISWSQRNSFHVSSKCCAKPFNTLSSLLSGPCSEQGIGVDALQRSLPIYIALWFCADTQC